MLKHIKELFFGQQPSWAQHRFMLPCCLVAQQQHDAYAMDMSINACCSEAILSLAPAISIGKNVFDFKPGDRVAAYHEFNTVDGAFGEYSVAPSWATFHLPANVSFEEGATIPLAALTAAVALYADMRLPLPFNFERGSCIHHSFL